MNNVKKWIKKAKRDLEAAKVNFKEGFYEVSLFLLQQSVEKALKGLYIKRFNKLIKTHDLVILGRTLNLPKVFIDYCKELSPAYVYTRYPDVEELKDIKGVAKKFIEYSEEIIVWIEKSL